METEIIKAMTSSESTEWETPQDFFDELDRMFHFTLDVCATPQNAKCARYFTKEDDGLAQDWGTHICWMNPPYGNPEYPCKANCQKKRCQKRGYHVYEYVPGIVDWVRKAYESSLGGALVVGLLPARTDTEWFHEWVLGKADIKFVRGRLRFGEAKSSALFPSLIAIYGGSQ